MVAILSRGRWIKRHTHGNPRIGFPDLFIINDDTTQLYLYGFVQDCGNSIANILELPVLCQALYFVFLFPLSVLPLAHL